MKHGLLELDSIVTQVVEEARQVESSVLENQKIIILSCLLHVFGQRQRHFKLSFREE